MVISQLTVSGMCIHYQHPLPLPLTHPPAPPRMRCEDYSSSESTLCENVDLIMELPETTHKCAWSHTHIKTHSKHTQTHTTKHHYHPVFLHGTGAPSDSLRSQKAKHEPAEPFLLQLPHLFLKQTESLPSLMARRRVRYKPDPPTAATPPTSPAGTGKHK